MPEALNVKQQQQKITVQVNAYVFVNAHTHVPFMFAYDIHGVSAFACSNAILFLR